VAGKTLIIGVGNLLLKDEGVGIHVAQELQRKDLPAGVEVYDGGVAGIGLLDFFRDASKLLLIDAAEMNLKPGTVVRFTPENVKDLGGGGKFSTHDVGLLEVLELAKALGHCPEDVVIIGIQPKEISWGTDLSLEVRASIPQVMEMVLKEISSNFIATEVTEATENNKMNKEGETSTP
jgi:hydrogenase maturation protease